MLMSVANTTLTPNWICNLYQIETVTYTKNRPTFCRSLHQASPEPRGLQAERCSGSGSHEVLRHHRTPGRRSTGLMGSVGAKRLGKRGRKGEKGWAGYFFEGIGYRCQVCMLDWVDECFDCFINWLLFFLVGGLDVFHASWYSDTAVALSFDGFWNVSGVLYGLEPFRRLSLGRIKSLESDLREEGAERKSTRGSRSPQMDVFLLCVFCVFCVLISIVFFFFLNNIFVWYDFPEDFKGL